MISIARRRRCPPRVRMAEILPALAQRVTVFGLTRNISATSDGVRRASGSVRSCIAFPLLTELATQRSHEGEPVSASSPRYDAVPFGVDSPGVSFPHSPEGLVTL